jgi:hypothetical protein
MLLQSQSVHVLTKLEISKFFFHVYINVETTYLQNIENIVHTLPTLKVLLTRCLEFYKKKILVENGQEITTYYLSHKEIISEKIVYEDLIEIAIDCTHRFIEKFIENIYLDNKPGDKEGPLGGGVKGAHDDLSQRDIVTEKAVGLVGSHQELDGWKGGLSRRVTAQKKKADGSFLIEMNKLLPLWGRKANKDNIKFKLNKNDLEVFESYVNEWHHYSKNIILKAFNDKVTNKLILLKKYLEEVFDSGVICMHDRKSRQSHGQMSSNVEERLLTEGTPKEAKDFFQLFQQNSVINNLLASGAQDRNRISFLFKDIMRGRNDP